MQVPIDHASRHSFIQDPLAITLFFLPMYGLLVFVIPFAFKLGLQKKFWAIGASFLLLFLLGLGNTTPLPRLLFGQGWAWLTYDRFSFWASLILLLFSGIEIVVLRRKFPQLLHRSLIPNRARRVINISLIVLMSFIALLVGSISFWLPTQPVQLDMQPIVDFLAQADHSYWRYITFGFGDQFAYLSRLTKATTIDGSYHTARTLPELRNSGIGQIDSAYWIPDGLAALDPILQKSGDRGVRWGFVNLKNYDPVLEKNGWRPITTLSNGIEVWENPTFSFPQPVAPPSAAPITSFAWGTLPLLSLSLSGLFALRRYSPSLSQRVLVGIESIAAGLLPIGLSFWYYQRLFAVPHERIYFTYTDPLFFLADGLAFTIVLAWLLKKNLHTEAEPISWRALFSRPGGWLFILCMLATFSTTWSLDWRTSLYVSLHLWLVYGLYHALSETPSAWRSFALGSSAALLLQIIIGGWQFASQSTAFTMALKLDWPGSLLPSMSGASVVQLAKGTRWLRAYGTFPHPNLLGGWTLALMAPLLASILSSPKIRILPIILFDAGLAILALTFSRAAWLGMGALSGLLLVHYKRLERKSLLALFFSGLLCLALIFIPLRSLVATRLETPQVQTEQVSSFTRWWLVERTWEIIQQHPILGVGIGSFPLALSQHVARFYDIEPVHNIPLLAWSELGIIGIAIIAGLAFLILTGAFKALRPRTIVLSATLVGVLTIGLLDHYIWTLAPGRLLFGTLLGLWSGQVKDERSS
jgi:O-antigen ligase